MTDWPSFRAYYASLKLVGTLEILTPAKRSSMASSKYTRIANIYSPLFIIAMLLQDKIKKKNSNKFENRDLIATAELIFIIIVVIS